MKGLNFNHKSKSTVTAPSTPNPHAWRPDRTLQITDDPLELALRAGGSHGDWLQAAVSAVPSCLGLVSRSQTPWLHLQGEEAPAVRQNVQTAEGCCSEHKVAPSGHLPAMGRAFCVGLALWASPGWLLTRLYSDTMTCLGP